MVETMTSAKSGASVVTSATNNSKHTTNSKHSTLSQLSSSTSSTALPTEVSRINIITSSFPLKVERAMPTKLKMYVLASEWTGFCNEIDSALAPLNKAFRHLKIYVYTSLGLCTFLFFLYMVFSALLELIHESIFIFIGVPLMAIMIFAKFIIIVYIGYKLKEANKSMEFVCNVMSAKKQKANLYFTLRQKRKPILIAGCCQKGCTNNFVRKVFNSHIEVHVGRHPMFGGGRMHIEKGSNDHHDIESLLSSKKHHPSVGTVPTGHSSIPEVMTSSTDGILQDLERNIERDQMWCAQNGVKEEKKSRWR